MPHQGGPLGEGGFPPSGGPPAKGPARGGRGGPPREPHKNAATGAVSRRNPGAPRPHRTRATGRQGGEPRVAPWPRRRKFPLVMRSSFTIPPVLCYHRIGGPPELGVTRVGHSGFARPIQAVGRS